MFTIALKRKVKSRLSTSDFCLRMISGEIGTGLTCDSQYFEIYNFQYNFHYI